MFGVLWYFGYRGRWRSTTLFVDAGPGYGFGTIQGDSKLLSRSCMGGGADLGLDFGYGFSF